MLIGSLIDFDKEVRSKKDYQPSAEESAYNERLKREYRYDVDMFKKDERLLNDRSPYDYIRKMEDTSIAYVPPKKDPKDWESQMKWTDPRDKMDAFLSFLLDLSFHCEPKAQDFLGNVDTNMGDVAEAVIRHIEVKTNTDDNERWERHELYSKGTVAKEIKWGKLQTMVKTGREWDEEDDPETYDYRLKQVDTFEGVLTNLLKLNRVLVGNIAEREIDKQPHIWKEYMPTYAQAYSLFSHFKRWQYVRPWSQQTDNWTDEITDLETESDERNQYVRVRIYESITTNEMAVYCNDVLMTPIGLAMPDYCRGLQGDLHYDVILQQASIISPFFYLGRSYLDALRRYSEFLDVLRNTLINKSRQMSKMPMQSSFRFMVNKYMFAPGSVTQASGGELKSLLPDAAISIQPFFLEAMKMLQADMDKMSISPAAQGQSDPNKTKYAVQQDLINAIRTVCGLVAGAVNLKKQQSEAYLRLGLKYLPDQMSNPKMDTYRGLKKLVVGGMDGNSSRELVFADALGAKPMDIGKELANQENAKRAKGSKAKLYFIEKGKLKDYTISLDYRVVPQAHDSKMTDMNEIKQKALLYQSLQVEQEATQKMVVENFGDDWEDFKPQQQAQPQQGQQPGQPGQPQGQPPQQGQPQPQPNQPVMQQ